MRLLRYKEFLTALNRYEATSNSYEATSNSYEATSDRYEVILVTLTLKSQLSKFNLFFRDSQLMFIYSEYNTQARLYNSCISSSQQDLEVIKTSAGTVPAGFPVNTYQITTMNSIKVF